MKTFQEWLNEIAYTGDLKITPKPIIRKKLDIIPSSKDDGVVNIKLDASFFNFVLSSSIANQLKPIPEKIYEIFQKAEENYGSITLSASDIYDLKRFVDEINKISKNSDDRRTLMKGSNKILQSLESALSTNF